MATAAVDRTLKVWDVRKLEGPLQQYKLHAVASNLAFSQRGLLAIGMGNVVEVQVYCVKAQHIIVVSYDANLFVLQKQVSRSCTGISIQQSLILSFVICFVNILSSEPNYTNIIFHSFRFYHFGVQFCLLGGTLNRNFTVVSGIVELPK